MGHLEGTEEERAYRVIWGDLSERSHLEELGIDKTKLFKTYFQAIEWSGEIDWTGIAEWSTDGLL